MLVTTSSNRSRTYPWSAGGTPADTPARYLLGSGGTLLFDLTIMLQSLIYGSAPPISSPAEHLPPTSRRRLFRRRTQHHEDGTAALHTERSPLLSSGGQLAGSQQMMEDDSPHMASSQLYRSTVSTRSLGRSRTRSKSPGAGTALRMTLGSRSPERIRRRDLSTETAAAQPREVDPGGGDTRQV